MSIRPNWLHETTSVCQVFIGETFDLAVDEFITRLIDLDKRLPKPATPLESLVHESLIVKVCLRRLGSKVWLLQKAMNTCGFANDNTQHDQPQTVARDQAIAVKSIIEARYTEPITLRSLGRRLHQHRNMLARSFRRTYGVAFHDYLVGVRVEKASELLVTTAYKVEAIAEMVGYRSKKNFYVEFRRLTGETPALYRARHAQRANRNDQVHNDT